jgi:hypothetical protein
VILHFSLPFRQKASLSESKAVILSYIHVSPTSFSDVGILAAVNNFPLLAGVTERTLGAILHNGGIGCFSACGHK